MSASFKDDVIFFIDPGTDKTYYTSLATQVFDIEVNMQSAKIERDMAHLKRLKRYFWAETIIFPMKALLLLAFMGPLNAWDYCILQKNIVKALLRKDITIYEFETLLLEGMPK